MLQRIDSRELTEWMAYFKVQSEGDQMDGMQIVEKFSLEGKI